MRILIALLLITLTGCVNMYYMVSTELLTSGTDVASLPEITASPEYSQLMPNALTIAVQPPTDCINENSSESTGAAALVNTVLSTRCGVAMAEIERALSASGYHVITWSQLKKEVKSASVAADMGADVLLQINSLDYAAKNVGGELRRDRRYYKSSLKDGEQGEEKKFSNNERNIVKNSLYKYESNNDAGALSVSLDVTAVWAKTARNIWYYRWMKSEMPDASHSKTCVLMECKYSSTVSVLDGGLDQCDGFGPIKEKFFVPQAKPCSIPLDDREQEETSGESEAITDVEGAQVYQNATRNRLMKEVIADMVKSFSSVRR